MNLLDSARKAFMEALKYNDLDKAHQLHKVVNELEARSHKMNENPMEESEAEMDAGAQSINAQIDANNLAMQQMWLINKADPWAGVDFTSKPGSLYASPPAPPTSGGMTGAMTGRVSGGGNIVKWNQVLHPMQTLKEPSQADKDTDKRRHLKLFVHFAKEFATRYPKWTVVPDEADPFHSVHLVRKDIGAIIHNLYPMNEMAVYGGPASWTDPRKELGQPLPVVKVNTQEFWGWCIGMDDVPEWMVA